MNIVKISKIMYLEYLNMKKLFMKILIVEFVYFVVWFVLLFVLVFDYVLWFIELVSMFEIFLFLVRFLFIVFLW